MLRTRIILRCTVRTWLNTRSLSYFLGEGIKGFWKVVSSRTCITRSKWISERVNLDLEPCCLFSYYCQPNHSNELLSVRCRASLKGILCPLNKDSRVPISHDVYRKNWTTRNQVYQRTISWLHTFRCYSPWRRWRYRSYSNKMVAAVVGLFFLQSMFCLPPKKLGSQKLFLFLRKRPWQTLLCAEFRAFFYRLSFKAVLCRLSRSWMRLCFQS